MTAIFLKVRMIFFVAVAVMIVGFSFILWGIELVPKNCDKNYDENPSITATIDTNDRTGWKGINTFHVFNVAR